MQWLIIFYVLFKSSFALADNIAARCDDDLLKSADLGRGRNAWSRKCGYITSADEEFFNAKGVYVVYSSISAPTDASAECVSGLMFLAYCAVGCYTPEQRLLFADGWLSIAAATKQSLVATPKNSDLQSALTQIDLQPISHFTRGPERGRLVRIGLDTGRVLRVTADHPLVLASGVMVRADAVEVGTQLAGMRGPVAVVTAETEIFAGDVWNVRPVSEKKIDNVFFVEEVLTGSQRFQYEWAHDLFRRHMRLRDWW